MDSAEGEIMKRQTAPIYIVSGGTGASGEQIVHTVLVHRDWKPIPIGLRSVRS
jgi:hypothetical protein